MKANQSDARDNDDSQNSAVDPRDNVDSQNSAMDPWAAMEQELAMCVSIEAAELRLAREEGRPPVLQFPNGAPLHMACWWANAKCVRELLDARADVDVCDHKGNYPLHALLTSPVMIDVDAKIQVIKLLLNAGASVNARNARGKAPADLTRNDSIRKALGAQSLALIKAALKCDAELLCKGLQEITDDTSGGMSVDIRDADGWSALHLACLRPASACATLLIQARACVNAITPDTQQRPMHLAARSGSFDIAKHLLEAHADPNLYEADQEHNWKYSNASYDRDPSRHKTPLHLAAEVANVVLMRMLLEARADVDARDSYQCTPLHAAIENARDNGDLPVSAGIRISNVGGAADGQLGAIVGCRAADRCFHDPDSAKKSDDRCFPVLVAGFQECLSLNKGNFAPVCSEAIDLLLDFRADVNLGNHRIGMDQSVLHEAVHVRDLSMIKKAISSRACVNAQRKGSGFTPLHLAVRQRSAAMIKLLRQASADVNLSNSSGKTAIDLAVANKIPADVALALVDDAALRSAPTACLVASASLGNIELVKSCIAAKASMNQLSEQKASAFSKVMQCQSAELVKLLVEARCSLHTSKTSRKRPLEEMYLS